MNSIANLEANSRNALRSYPFTDDAVMAFSGGFIPNDLFLDAHVYCRHTLKTTLPCYISNIKRTNKGVVFTVSTTLKTVGLSEMLFGSTADLIEIKDGSVVAGCFVIDPTKLYIMEAIAMGDHPLTADVMPLLPAVQEVLAGPVVTTVNSLSGVLNLIADTGIKFELIDTNSLKVSVIGDPHFKRYGCNTAQQQLYNQTLNTTIRKIKLKFWTWNLADELVQVDLDVFPAAGNSYGLPIFASALGPDPADPTVRPALRLITSGSTATFSLAGAT